MWGTIIVICSDAGTSSAAFTPLKARLVVFQLSLNSCEASPKIDISARREHGSACHKSLSSFVPS